MELQQPEPFDVPLAPAQVGRHDVDFDQLRSMVHQPRDRCSVDQLAERERPRLPSLLREPPCRASTADMRKTLIVVGAVGRSPTQQLAIDGADSYQGSASPM